MENPSRARSFMSLSYAQCFICREWKWNVSRCLDMGRVELCLVCYVDVLEVREARGVMGPGISNPEGADAGQDPGNSPSPVVQLDMFRGMYE